MVSPFMKKIFNYPPLNIYAFQIIYQFIEDAELPEYNKGNIIRGALGETLKKLVCMGYAKKCGECPTARQQRSKFPRIKNANQWPP